MCLISHRKEPFIAQKDLKVFKILSKIENNTYKTPCMNVPAKLGELMKGKGDNVYRDVEDNYIITEGYIHSKSSVINYIICTSDVLVEAYIPKGTKYYIGVNNDICSEILQLTDKVYYSVNDRPSLSKSEWNDLYAPVMNLIPKDNVGIGWIIDHNLIFIHPSNVIDIGDIAGIVSGFDNDNNIIVINPNILYNTWNEVNTLKLQKPWIMGTINDYKNTIGKNLDIINMLLSELGILEIPISSWTQDIVDNEHAIIYDLQLGIAGQLTDTKEMVIPLLKCKIINGKTEIITNN